MLTLDHLTFHYDCTPCLQDISQKCPQGTLWTAPNGYGKTTLMRLIAHQLFPLHGSISLDNKTTYTAAFCPSPLILFEDLSIQTHLSWLKAQYDIPQKTLDLTLEQFQITDQNRAPKTLSKGEKQWLLLAITCLVPADIALFDEPLQALDDDKIARFSQILQEKLASGTHVFVTGHTLCQQHLSSILTPVTIRP
ncbi:MAG: ATP-binding cassette domain-containing protein [Proteobacteria bacterium]|nr:ATP-binding cassette domain-containing protein [Pseudomonadota bacterium]